MKREDAFISVDVETSGPIPGEYSLLSIGACDAERPDLTFYCCLKPTAAGIDAEAVAASGHVLDDLRTDGLDASEALGRFHAWVAQVAEGRNPTFVGFNAPFDWSFVNYYFHRYLGENPFGHSAVDIKAMYLGCFGGPWSDTKSSRMAEHLRPSLQPDHHALNDALFQAELFRLIRMQNHRSA